MSRISPFTTRPLKHPIRPWFTADFFRCSLKVQHDIDRDIVIISIIVIEAKVVIIKEDIEAGRP